MRAEDEAVAVYDADGREIGVAPRGVVYRDRRWHASSAVLVRSGDGERVYLHRRAPDKLIFPGCYDCWAGGVLGPGEAPEDGAARELEEELGVRSVPLLPRERVPYDDGTLRCHLFTYEARWDGPLRHQPEEVVWGEWVTLAQLRTRLDDPGRWPFVPDGRVAIERWLAARARPSA
ncbi:NUDIX domain-containing protein [Pseudonocardia sp. MH-G8]|uniref:NUDIX domain-containing protein n=1 Tax=Pseudonocardia sp. MH-G8 TaxID=1854588 RepID=UPI0018E915B8|nr:NUDIX domain-containing protein [Pseudonocardia sp. MH-G8]